MEEEHLEDKSAFVLENIKGRDISIDISWHKKTNRATKIVPSLTKYVPTTNAQISLLISGILSVFKIAIGCIAMNIDNCAHAHVNVLPSVTMLFSWLLRGC